MEETKLLNVSTSICGWRVVRFLGMGQSGEVYEVEKDGRRAALKIRRGEQATVSPEEFGREIETAKRQPAPGRMPQFFAAGEWEHLPFFVMELAVGAEMPDTARGFIDLASGLIDAVGSLHRHRHTHNDIKPSNVGVIDGRVVLLDFGSALPFRTGETDGIRVGTDGFMAPEVDRDGLVSSVADIHALGVTLKAMCPPALRRMFEPVFSRATATQPGLRTATPEKLREDLLGCVSDYRREVAAASRLDKFKAMAKRAALVVGAALVAYGVIAAMTYGNRRGKMLALKEREIQAQAEYVSGIGCKDLGDLTNAVRLLERALKGGYRPAR